jgi:hypothetical protein
LRTHKAARGRSGDPFAALGNNFDLVGYLTVAFFIMSWMVSYLIYKAKGYDQIKVVAEPAKSGVTG